MKPLSAKNLRGNWATLLLPINEDDSIDFVRLADEIDILISMKVSGIYSNGTACEFYNQTESEFDRISELLAERCNRAGAAFQIGVSHTGPVISLERLKRAVVLQPGAVQVILPDWVPVTMNEAADFLKKMAEIAGDIGMVLYNPGHAKRCLTPEEIGFLKRAVPSLIGVKLAGGNEAWFSSMKQHAPGIAIFVPGHHLASMLQLGAHGSYSNVACINPKAAQCWYVQMLTDIDAALASEKRIFAFIDTCIKPYITEQNYSCQAVDKLMAVIGGWANLTPRLRFPYRWIPQEEADRLKPIARKMLPEFFYE
ncbi:dihydrodipicolinate synthase family protein [candidate division KSB1 bacterium]|nr:dihydrodipicolinate synthase family protein [candidate division KSB1 bacterium]